MAQRSVGNSQLLSLFGQEGAAALLFKEIAQTIGAAMLHRKGRDGKIRTVEEFARTYGDEFDRHGGVPAAQHDRIDQIMDAIQGSRATVNLELIDSLPTHERGEQSGQAENVVKVSVGNENAVQTFEADAGLQNLTLGSFATIHQKAVFIMLNQV